jgi:hypothetical protein
MSNFIDVDQIAIEEINPLIEVLPLHNAKIFSGFDI